MSRSTRVEFDGACYHIMSRGVARMMTFRYDADSSSFLEGVGQVVEEGLATLAERIKDAQKMKNEDTVRVISPLFSFGAVVGASALFTNRRIQDQQAEHGNPRVVWEAVFGNEFHGVQANDQATDPCYDEGGDDAPDQSKDNLGGDANRQVGLTALGHGSLH
jgi:hypothetical protein